MSPISKKPRVAILADPIWDSIAGVSGRGDGQAATWLPQFARFLFQSDDLHVSWVSLRRGLKVRRTRNIDGHSLIELPGYPITLDVPTGYRLARASLLAELGRIQPDVVHCWGTERPYPAVLGMQPAPGLLSMNGILGELRERKALPEGWKWHLQQCHEKRWLRRADIVVVESEWAGQAVRRIAPASKIETIHYGVHPSFYAIEWHPEPDAPKLLFAGTAVGGKGLDVLIDALQILHERDWVCEIAGDGPLRAPLQALGTAKTEWLGTLGWQDYQHHLAKAWALVLPTLADSNPNVVKEARVVGLPIVTTAFGGQAEYLIHGTNSIVLDQLDPAKLAGALRELMSRGINGITAMGAHGHEADRERFRPEKTVHAFKKLYRNMSKGN